MGSEKEEREVVCDQIGSGCSSRNTAATVIKRCVACFCSFLVSITGGLILVWWEFKYHPTNSELWMVPLGLILLGTPLIACFSILLSALCNGKKAGALRTGQSVVSPDGPVYDPERPKDHQ